MSAVSVVLDTPLSAVPQGTQLETAGGAGLAFGTKAETLERLAPLVHRARILDLVYFAVAEWESDRSAVLQRLSQRFAAAWLAVRSSAAGEDGADSSQAGAYSSYLDVDGADRHALEQAIDAVIASYPGNPLDQVLVQPMLAGVALSGVVTTHDMERGSPFYVLNYDDESGRTDSITGGTGVNKAVLVFRHAEPRHIEMARELEAIGGPVPLDIEFAMTHRGELYISRRSPRRGASACASTGFREPRSESPSGWSSSRALSRTARGGVRAWPDRAPSSASCPTGIRPRSSAPRQSRSRSLCIAS